MKLKILILSILLSPIFLNAQNVPACDSVFIDCCTFDSPDENTISIVVSNYSSDIFYYPGFILFTEEMDTVAIETVNYYGIGWSQIHIMIIIQPLELPFDGIIELHTGFYETQICAFPVFIPDSTLTQIENKEMELAKVFPNPANDFLNIEIKELPIISNIFISDINGRHVKKIVRPQSSTINISDLKTGLYFIRIMKEDGKAIHTRFIKQ